MTGKVSPEIRRAYDYIKINYNHSPRCEVCKREKAYSFSLLRTDSLGCEDWFYTGTCTEDVENYFIFIDDYLKDKEDWNRHLSTKIWHIPLLLKDAVNRFEKKAKRKNNETPCF